MGTNRIRVREPINVAGALIALALLGLVCGATLVHVPEPLTALVYRLGADRASEWQLVRIVSIAMLVIIIATPLTPIVFVLTAVQRWRVVLGGAALLGLTIIVGGALCGTLSPPYEPLSTVPSGQFWEQMSEFGSLLVVMPILVALLAAIAAATFRLVAYRVIERDGDLCARCGYRLVESTTARCPECGLDDPARGVASPLATRVAAVVGRRRALWSALVVGLILGAIAWIAVLEAPFVRFNRTFGDWGSNPNRVLDEWADGEPLRAEVVSRETDPGPREILGIGIARTSSIAPLRMWLAFDHLDNPWSSTPPLVRLELHGRDIRRVLRDGVPEATIERMRAAHAARDAPTQVVWLEGGLDD